MLELSGIAAHYGRSQALFGVSLTVAAGEAVAILGPNAAGKSTTLKCISRLMPTSAGRITLEGVDIARWSTKQVVSAGVVQVPEGRQLFPFLTVQENLEVGAYSPRARGHRAESLRDVYERLPLLAERRRQLAGTLSGGEQQMVAIGRALMARPRLLMLDEPSLGLSPIMVQHVFSIVNDLKQTGLTILLVEQNMAQALRVVDRAYVLNTGVTVMEADAGQMRTDPRDAARIHGPRKRRREGGRRGHHRSAARRAIAPPIDRPTRWPRPGRRDPGGTMTLDVRRELDMAPLINPASIAVVGASQRADALGTAVISNLQAVGYTGSIYPINPRYEEVAGLRCYPGLDGLPSTPDAVFVAIPAAGGPDVVEEAGRLGVRAAFLNASGYSDGGAEGKELQRRIEDSAARYGMAICGPNNTGLINFHDHVAAWTTPLPTPRIGPVAVITQSGSASMVLAEGPRGLGLSYVITCGNEAVANMADYLSWVVDDERVGVITLFMETIRNPAKFEAAALRAAARNVPILAVKIGRTESGRAAVAAHTGSLAGDDRVYDAFFRRCGVVRAGDLDELIELATLFGVSPGRPKSPHTVPITFSGGEAALVADIGTSIGLSMPPIGEPAMAKVRASLPPFASPRNPLDAFGLGFDIGKFTELMDGLLTDPSIGVVAPAIDAPENGGIDADYGVAIAELYRRLLPTTDQKLVLINNSASSGIFPKLLEITDGTPIPVLTGMREGLIAIQRWATHRGPRPSAEPATDLDADQLAALRNVTDVERFDALRAVGIPFAPALAADSVEEAVTRAEELGYPVVVKGAADGLIHKTDAGLVELGLADADSVRAAAERILRGLASWTDGHLVVQQMAERGVELIVGTRVDPQFGTVVVVGPGGVFVELTRDVAVRLGPVDAATAEEMLDETVAGKLLAGVRGSPAADRAAAVAAITRISQVAHAARASFRALEVNPLIVLPAGRGAVAVDLVIE